MADSLDSTHDHDDLMDQPLTDRPNKGGNRGGRTANGRPPPTRDVQISKKLSWLLRHGATSENLPLDSAGYANLADVLKNRKIRGLKPTLQEVREVVGGSEKQRFGLKVVEGGDEGSERPADWLIRANQGHSVALQSEGLLEAITLEGGRLPETVVHGTSHAAWVAIVASGGLKPMGRNHVHFAPGLPSAFAAPADRAPSAPEPLPVLSGMRTSSTVLIYLDLPKALAAGLKFWRSANGVVLSEGAGGSGEQGGRVGLEFFRRVEDRAGLGVLVEDGKIVQDAPEKWAGSGRGGRGAGGRGGRGRGRG